MSRGGGNNDVSRTDEVTPIENVTHHRARNPPGSSECFECNVYLLLRGTFRASDIPTIWFVSQPAGRFTDCNKK
jgi:hypothetical protein